MGFTYNESIPNYPGAVDGRGLYQFHHSAQLCYLGFYYIPEFYRLAF